MSFLPQMHNDTKSNTMSTILTKEYIDLYEKMKDNQDVDGIINEKY